VSVIDESGDAHTGMVTATMILGHAPIGIAVDPTTHAVYVTMGNSDYVVVIDESRDARSGTVVARIPVGREA
jgi:DNA-binding beta-propeller fold protein YncE